MGRFSRKFPLVKIELIEESTGELEELLNSGKIDFLLDNCMLDENIFESSVLKEEHLVLAVPESFKVNNKLKSYQLTVDSIRTVSYTHLDVYKRQVSPWLCTG